MADMIAGSEQSISSSLDNSEQDVTEDQGVVDEETEEKSSPQKTISHQDFWAMFTGMKLKEFTDAEMEAFKKPFLIGWKREVVLRGTISQGGKKIGDVYYFSPDKKIKLRSYVEMGLFLKKNPNSDLEPENFTFARQPIYEPPQEIVRHAMARGSNQTSEATIIQTPPIIHPAKIASPAKPVLETKTEAVTPAPARRSLSTNSSMDEPEIYTGGIAEGRAKRKRTAPTRFEDEDYNEASPFKRKPTEKPVSKTPVGQSPLAAASKDSKVSPIVGKTGLVIKLNKKGVSPHVVDNKQIETPSKLVSALSDPSRKVASVQKPQQVVKPSINSIQVKNPRVLGSSDNRTSQQTVGHAVKQETTSTNGASIRQPSTSTPKSNESGTVTSLLKPKTSPNSTSSSILMNGSNKPVFKAIRPKPRVIQQQQPILQQMLQADDGVRYDGEIIEEPYQGEDGKAMVPPCSIVCGNGQVPSLLCFRCLCLFHTSCVLNGLCLDNDQFVCPNCIQPTDEGKRVSESHHMNGDSSDSDHQEINNSKHSRLFSRLDPLSQKTPSLLQAHLTKNRYPPILPKPSSSSSSLSTPMMKQRQKSHLELLQLFQQQTSKNFLSSHHREQALAKQNSRPRISTGHDGQLPLKPQVSPSRSKVHEFLVKSGHHTIKYPMLGKPVARSSNGSRAVMPHGLLSREKHQQMSKMIHSQLKSLAPSYQPPPIAPIAPIKVTPAQIASFLDKMTNNRYRDYLDNLNSPMNRIMSGFDVLSHCLEYLDRQDLMNLRSVSRSFKRFVTNSESWQKLQNNLRDSVDHDHSLE